MSDESEGEGGFSSLASISEGAGLFLVGRVCSNLIGTVTSIILTRTLGTRLYGIFTYQSIVFRFVRVFTTLGSDNSILRFLPEYEEDTRLQHVMLTLAYATSLVASIVVAILVYYLAPLISSLTLEEPLFVEVLRIAALVLPFNTLTNIITSGFKAIERMDYNVAITSVFRPLMRLVFVGGAVLLGYSVIGATAGFVVMGVVVFLASASLLVSRTDLGGVGRPTRERAREYYNFSIPLIFNQIGSVFYSRIDILMVGFFLSSSAVGIYNVAVVVSGFLSLPLSAFNQLFPPIASRLYQNGERAELDSVYGTVTRWIFTVSLFPGIAAIFYADSLLQVFGSGFTRGQLVLVLFAVAQLTNCLVGPSGYLLMMSDHQYLTMANQLLAGGLNVVLNYLFITEFGFVGAAAATASVLAGINLLRVAQVWYLEGMSPYGRHYFKPVVAGVVAAGVLYAASLSLDRYVLLVVGGGAGGLAYVGVLYLLGFEESERELFERLLPVG